MLTDKERKKVIADYLETQNYCKTAQRNGITDKTVARIVKENNGSEITEKIEQKKKENTEDVLQYMDTLIEKKKDVLKLSLDNMIDKLENDKVSPTALATIYGVLLDKELKAKELGQIKQTNSINRIMIVNDLPKED